MKSFIEMWKVLKCVSVIGDRKDVGESEEVKQEKWNF